MSVVSKKERVALGVRRNWLLAQLPPADFERLRPQLREIDLPLEMNLEFHKEPIERVVFPADGIVSVVGYGGAGAEIEVGLIGREGLTGLPLILGNDRWPHRLFMQSDGAGSEIDAVAFRAALDELPPLRRLAERYLQAFMHQVTSTALANGWATIDQRLARWLLMASDRLASDVIAVTHEFLSYMLAVRRAGVTDAIHVLEGKKLIHGRRGEIELVEKAGLRERARAIYGFAESEYVRLLGDWRTS